MLPVFLSSCYDMPIIKQIADLLGYVMNFIYIMLDKVGIANIGLCIILFTFIVKLLMFPLTLKQQKFSKISSLINPELQAIQKKYKGKNDQDSMMRMQEETKALYDKYGVSQTGGCLQMLIQMPILFALYAVISCMPDHVTDIREIYINDNNSGIVDVVYEDNTSIVELDQVYKVILGDGEYKFTGIKNFVEPSKKLPFDKSSKDKVYDALTNISYSEKNLNVIDKMYADVIGEEGLLNYLDNLSADEWDKLIKGLNDEVAKLDATADASKIEEYNKKIKLLEKYKDADYTSIKADYISSFGLVEKNEKKIEKVYDFLTIDLSKSPSTSFGLKEYLAILIPILSYLSQWLSMKISSGSQSQSMADNPMGSSMKMMNITMPLISAFFCWSLPAGLGVYWVISSVFQILQQLAVNLYFKNLDIQKIIDANAEKASAKMERRKQFNQSIAEAAKSNTKSISYRANSVESTAKEVVKEAPVQEKEVKTTKKAANTKSGGSIAARANMVKEFNEKNNK
ncbi:MAG: YidC/Oxa1 family membrane protein insertase [Lachnospiraceae bacterium]|nr:YidC/Oxa1 family membrane protein insertase [Lachnospiraceae bacterium]